MKNSSNSSRIANWPESKDYRKSIRVEFSIYMSLMIIFLMGVVGYMFMSQYSNMVTESVIEKQLVQARSYARAASKHILAAEGPDALMLNDICKKLSQDDAGIFSVGITNENGEFIAHTDLKYVITNKIMGRVYKNDLFDFQRNGETVELKGDTAFLSIDIKEQEHPLGRLLVTSSASSIGAARKKSALTVGLTTITVLLFGLPFIMVFLNRKLKPIKTITESLRRVDPEKLTFEIPFRNPNELGYLAETLRVMGDRLVEAQSEVLDKERMANELEAARDIQANILPRSYPSSSSFEFAGSYTSAKEVGGDYYDFFEIDDRYLACLVADVSGKSLPGMLVMLMTRDIIKNMARTIIDPVKLLSKVNAELLNNIRKGMFVTMLYGILDRHTGQFRFSSAGHNPLIIMKKDGTVQQINPKGYPLGLMPVSVFDNRIEIATVDLDNGDWMIQYTDGINEAHNEKNEEFGVERLIELLRSHTHLHPKDLIDSIMTYHKSFVGKAPQFDDITIVALNWKQPVSEYSEYNVKENTGAN